MKLTCWTVTTQGLPIVVSANTIQPRTPFSNLTHQTQLEADPGNLVDCITRTAAIAETGLLITLPPDLVALNPQWQDMLVKAAQNNPEAVFFYGDYLLADQGIESLQAVRKDIGDITEREDWGPVWAVRVDWLNGTGGLDQQNHRAGFYDLLLKSWGKRMHVGGTLGTVAVSRSDESESDLKSKLFFPGRGKLGGFSYLFMDKEDERQTEEVFYNFLKREGAWLEGERRATPRDSFSSPSVGETQRGFEGQYITPNPSTEGQYITPPPFTGGQGGVRISIVTPVYNRARFINLAIESVQRQTFTDWEYVIVDNGSTDNTRDVVRSYAAKDSRIRLVENDQNVIALSLNLGVKNARGKYISQLDSDDEYFPHTLEKMVDALETHPTWGIAISYYELMDEEGHSLPEFGIIRHEQYNRNNILRRDGAGALRFWHKSVIEEFGGFDVKELGHYGEDYDLVLKCGEKYEVGRVHEVCYRYRRHADNTDVLREPEMKIRNKTIARLNALKRRKLQNHQ